MFELNMVETVAFAGAVLFVGYGIRRLLPFLSRYNIPAPVLGGLVVAGAIWIARSNGSTLFVFDTALQSPLMIAFFTSIGFAASISLMRVGGPQVITLFVVCTIFAVVQNLIGIGIAVPLGLDPLFGVLAGSVTLTGGPATGLAFAPEFERAGLVGAATLAVASGMAGIVAGGVAGGPLATKVIERYDLRPHRRTKMPANTTSSAADAVETRLPEAVEPFPTIPPEGEDDGSYVLLKALVPLLMAMWVGGWISRWISEQGVTLPPYIGAMIIAAVIRNVDDVTGIVKLPHRMIDDIGNVALSFFLVLALMTLKLWELAGLALPLLLILLAQLIAACAFAYFVIFRLMAKDYDAGVMTGGFVGFMMGTTANAMANMRALVERYGPAPRAFLVVPMVGAFFIDFTNALIITFFLNVLR